MIKITSILMNAGEMVAVFHIYYISYLHLAKHYNEDYVVYISNWEWISDGK